MFYGSCHTIALAAASIKYNTCLYGIPAKIYRPTDNLKTALQNYYDMEYSDEPIFDGNFLIPKLIAKTSGNIYSKYDYAEDVIEAYTVVLLPKYSKIQINVGNEISSFIVSDIRAFEFSETNSVYYELELIATTAIDVRPDTVGNKDTVENEELDIIEDPEFEDSIQGSTTISDENPDSSIRWSPL